MKFQILLLVLAMLILGGCRTNNVSRVDYYELRQIIRINDGTVGGWIEKEKNLSHSGDAWVYGDARVFGDARVSGDAMVDKGEKK